MALKDLMNRLNCNDTRHEALPVGMDADTRGSYIANSTVLGLDKADYILLIGTNPRVEAPVYNARLRKMYLNGAQVRPGCVLVIVSCCCKMHLGGAQVRPAPLTTKGFDQKHAAVGP